MLILLAVSPLAAQVWKVQVEAPSPDAFFGWAQTAPEVQIKAALQKGEEKVVPKQGEVARLFLTGQVFEGERLIDNVPLWDDGTHGDERSGDGTYTATYRPPKVGEYRVRVRAQADITADGKTLTREFWSDFVPFKIVAIPYPQITQPEAGSEVKGKTSIRARILLMGKPFEERDETLTAIAQVEGEGWKRTLPLNRQGSLLTASITFPKRGTYRLTVLLSAQRSGKKLQSKSEAVEFTVSKLGYLLLVLSGFFFAVYLILPPKEPPLRYRHHLRFQHRSITLEPGETKRVDDLELKAAVGKREVQVKQIQGQQPILRKQGVPQWELTIKEGEQCQAGQGNLRYERAEPMREKPSFWHRLLPSTFPRCFVFLLALGCLAFWLWQWKQFAG